MTKPLPEFVASEVRAEMARQGMTHRTLAEHLGIDQAAVTRRLNGQVVIDVGELERIAGALDVPVTNFLPRTSADAA